VFGDKDADGFYWGELRGRRGYVPHNMVTEVDDGTGTMQGQMPGQMQGQMQGQMPGQMQGQMQGQMHGQMQGQVPGQMAGQMPGQMSGQMQGQQQNQQGGTAQVMPGQAVPQQSMRNVSRDRWGDIYATMPVKRMIALYDYDPQELSPNVDAEVSNI